jgi:hypothetical protein
MFYASRTDSAIVDELAHIPAGYGYVHNLSYDLNPEHPPLIKALAALPVLFINPVFPTTSTAWTTEVNGEWDMGYQFLYGVGNNAQEIIDTARFFPMLITLLVILLIWFLARGLMGNWWALLPAALFGLDPNVLAQGHYVTTDVGAAFGVVLSFYFFLKFVESPTTKHLWWAGLAFGIAQLTKFSTPLLIPVYLFLVLVLWLRNTVVDWHSTRAKFKTFFTRGVKWLWRVLLIFIIGYVLIVYPTYFLFTINYSPAKQVSDTEYLLGSFANGPTPPGQLCSGMRCFADADIFMAGNPALRPYAEYLLGLLMSLQRVDGGNTIYFLGQIREDGGWRYFPVLFLLKEPIPTLIIIFLALIIALWWMIRRDKREGRGRWRRILDYLGVNFAEFSMATFVIVYWAYSIHSPLNIGFRHLMPTVPLIYILAAVVWRKWITRFPALANLGGSMTSSSMTTPEAIFASVAATTRSLARSFMAATIKYIALILLLVWLFIEVAFAAPYFLSYFNEFGGGIMNGYHYVTDSNYDWGQDLLRLQSWVNANPQVDQIAVDYFGGGEPSYYLGPKQVGWNACMGNPEDQGIHWFAVSINTLQGAIQPLAPGQTRNAQCQYSWLTALRPPGTGMGDVPTPDYRVGTSIFIYHLQ